MMKKIFFSQFVRLSFSLAASVLVSACINNETAPKKSSTTSSATGNTTPISASSSTGTYTLSTAFLTQSASTGTGTTPPPVFTLVFNAASQSKVTDVCAVQTGSNPDTSRACKCRFEWSEDNSSGSTLYSRKLETELTQVSGFQVQCSAPDIWDTEIPDGKVIKITMVPNTAKGNLSGFSTNTLQYTKVSNTATGDFRDAEGRSYQNISHYVCFDTAQKALTLTHKMQSPGNTNTQTNQPVSEFPLANEFSIGTGNTPTSFSAQSYYFDFYIITKEVGQINTSASGFICPRVNVNGQVRFFPLDSSFALSLNSSKDFGVQVVSQTLVAPQGSTVGNILGYATKPSSDGTCPAFSDSAGKIRRTFRLRKYAAVYPLRFTAEGDFLDKSQRVNTVYVLDRPVDRANGDPLKPITRLGPKPCPFSFKTTQFGQKCMTDSSLNGWNIDGTQIDGDPSCPIYPPTPDAPPNAVKADGTLVIRPYRPFLPNYLEDTSFKACTFQSGSPVDPEITLVHDDTINPVASGPNDFYCAKHYPPAGSIIFDSGASFDKAPGDCDLAAMASALKTNKSYACSRTYNPTNSNLNTPAAGCCQVCSGANCQAVGGGITPRGRNAAFSPPSDSGNPPQSARILPRSVPNQTGSSGCFEPYEN